MAFKTAAELDITEREHEALILTLGILEGEIDDRDLTLDMSTPGARVLEFCEDPENDKVEEPISICGTKACVGGTMSLLMQNGMKLPDVVTPEMVGEMSTYVHSYDSDGALHMLMWDRTDDEVTNFEVAQAIRETLAGNTTDPWLVNQ